MKLHNDGAPIDSASRYVFTLGSRKDTGPLNSESKIAESRGQLNSATAPFKILLLSCVELYSSRAPREDRFPPVGEGGFPDLGDVAHLAIRGRLQRDDVRNRNILLET